MLVDFYNTYVSGLITQCYFYDCPLIVGFDFSGLYFSAATRIELSICPLATYLTFNLSSTGTVYTFNINGTQITKVEWWANAWDRVGTINSSFAVTGDYFITSTYNELLYDLDQSCTVITPRNFNKYGIFPPLDNGSGGFDGLAAETSLLAKGWIFTQY